MRVEVLSEILAFMRTMVEEDQEAFIKLQNSMDENGKYRIIFNNNTQINIFAIDLNFGIYSHPIPVAYHIWNTLVDPKVQTKSKDEGRVISTNELADALDVIQGCCLLHYPSKELIGVQCQGVKLLLDHVLSQQSVSVQLAALDCLLALMVDCNEVQNEFHAHKGLKTLVDLLKLKTVRNEVRHKIAAVLLFMTRYFNEQREENKQRVQSLLGDKLTSALMQAVQLTNRTQDEKFEVFIKQLDQARWARDGWWHWHELRASLVLFCTALSISEERI